MDSKFDNLAPYAEELIGKGAPTKQSSKHTIKYTTSSFKTNTFTAELNGAEIQFQVVKMESSLLLWIGRANGLVFTDLSLAMLSHENGNPLSSKVIGSTSDTTSLNLATKLTKKLKKPVYVSCNVDLDLMSLSFIEKCLIVELQLNKELF